VAVVCPNPVHCLQCHWEGHQMWSCKRPQSPDAASPLHQFLRSSSGVMVVLNPRRGDIALGAPAAQPRHISPPKQQLASTASWAPSGGGASSNSTRDWMPSSPVMHSTPEGSPSCHVVLSSLPSSPSLGAMSHHPRFETRILPRMVVVDVMEAELAFALVTMVGGTHPAVTAAQINKYLESFYQVPA
jgi:hypothetical protein